MASGVTKTGDVSTLLSPTPFNHFHFHPTLRVFQIQSNIPWILAELRISFSGVRTTYTSRITSLQRRNCKSWNFLVKNGPRCSQFQDCFRLYHWLHSALLTGALNWGAIDLSFKCFNTISDIGSMTFVLSLAIALFLFSNIVIFFFYNEKVQMWWKEMPNCKLFTFTV